MPALACAAQYTVFDAQVITRNGSLIEHNAE